MNRKHILTPSEAQRFKTNILGKKVGTREPLYDTRTLAAAGGTTTLGFFQQVQGQAGITKSITNMEAAGAMPSPKQFLADGIELSFAPSATPNGYDALTYATIEQSFKNDLATLLHSGYLSFFIGSTEYTGSAPLGRFPSSWGLVGGSAVGGLAGGETVVDGYARGVGRTFDVAPVLLESNQNFTIQLLWEEGSPVLNGDVDIICSLTGTKYRDGQ